jgi:arabinan endo-1,5-alpha-L-arabinosidase
LTPRIELKRRVGAIALALAIVALAASCAMHGAPPTGQPEAIRLEGAYWRAHDPTIAKDGDYYYVFATGRATGGGTLPIHRSRDLRHWESCGRVFGEPPVWISKEVPGVRGLWAPDVSYFNGKYHLYYAFSLFGKRTSGIGLATTKILDPASPDYQWKDEGLVLRSTDADDYNAIDPSIALDKAGQPWMCFGSFWSGIKLRRIDPATGKPSNKDSQLYSIARRPKDAKAEAAGAGDTTAIEAPCIVHHGKFYYLFVSFDLCCRGADSTYRVMVGRSRRIAGPYMDRDGKPMMKSGGTEILRSNDAWHGPGGQSVLMGGGKGPDLIVFHAYDAMFGWPALQISTLAWPGGWPTAALARQ